MSETTEQAQRRGAQEKIGVVVCNKMDKTVVVAVEKTITAPRSTTVSEADVEVPRARRGEPVPSRATRSRLVVERGRCRGSSAGRCARSSSAPRRDEAMIQMGTILDVADNSGAKKIACIQHAAARSASTRASGDVITASVKEATPDGTVKKGQVVKAVIVRTVNGAAPPRRQLHPVRHNAAVLINDAEGADRNARVRSGGPRAAREAVHEDHLAGARSHLTASDDEDKTEDQEERPGAGHRRQGPGRAGRVLRVLPAKDNGDRRARQPGQAAHASRTRRGTSRAASSSARRHPLSNLMVIDPGRTSRRASGASASRTARHAVAKKSGATLS